MPDLLPLLWLCGPPGVGKSTVGWELFTGLPGAGHVDIDQLGMCYPTVPADPHRTVLEARILGRAVANFRAAGARCLIVSGYIDSRRGIHAEYLADADLSVVRLRCEQAELRRRLEARARPGEARDAALRHADVLDHSGLPYPCVDTTDRTATEVLSTVRDRWPVPPAPRPGPWPDVQPTPGRILWLCGPTAVGKSTVGFQVAQAARRAGHLTGFVDLQQIGFLRPAPDGDPGNHRLKAANLAALWQHFSAYGARRLVVVGPVDHPDHVRLYADALPAASVTLYRLHAGPGELWTRIQARASGGGPDIAGDELRGQPLSLLDRAYQAAVAQSERLDRLGIGDVRVDTDGRTVDDLTNEIALSAGW